MFFIGVYIFIALFTLFMVLMINLAASDTFNSSQPLIDLNTVLMSAFWPISVVCLIYIRTVDRYKDVVKRSVEPHVWSATYDISYLDTLSIKDLKRIQYAHEIDALKVSEEIEKRVRMSILNKEFENNFL